MITYSNKRTKKKETTPLMNLNISKKVVLSPMSSTEPKILKSRYVLYPVDRYIDTKMFLNSGMRIS